MRLQIYRNDRYSVTMLKYKTDLKIEKAKASDGRNKGEIQITVVRPRN